MITAAMSSSQCERVSRYWSTLCWSPACRIRDLAPVCDSVRVRDVLYVCVNIQAYIRPKSRTERSRKTKIGTEVAHVTRDSDATFKTKRTKVNLFLMS